LDFFVSVPGLGGKLPSPATEIEVIFVGQHVPYEIGPATVAVPGVPAGAHYLWQRWGRLPGPPSPHQGGRRPMAHLLGDACSRAPPGCPGDVCRGGY
jgi:gamma-glutamyltranspeptidase/glutathione hydrolase